MITLETFASSSAATRAYRQETSGAGALDTMSGVGTAANFVDLANVDSKLTGVCPPSGSSLPADCRQFLTDLFTGGIGGVYVERGGQILEVKSSAVGAVSALVRPDETLSNVMTLLQLTMVTQPKAVATELALRMTGQTSNEPYLDVPKDGLNACSVPASKLASKKVVASAQNVVSDTPPEQECVYTINGEEFNFYSETSAQATDSVPTTTLQDVYGAQAKGAAKSKHLTLGNGVTAIVYADGGDFLSGGLLLAQNKSGTDPAILLTIEPAEGASAGEIVTKNDCEELFAALPKDYIESETANLNFHKGEEGPLYNPTDLLVGYCYALAAR
ncbi:MAG: hypothetical protein ACRDVC_04495 [Acidimicrobiales bacterium]